MEVETSKPENDETPSSILEVDLLKEAKEAYLLANSKYHEFGAAVKKIQELCEKHSDSGILFGTQALILSDICHSNKIKSYEEKKRYLKNAITCAKRSTECSPNSMFFWSFLGYLLYRSSNNSYEIMEAIETFNTALKISNPTDPIEESPRSSLSPTYQERIQDVRQDILNYLAVCVSALKDLGVFSSVVMLRLQCMNLEKQEKVKLYWRSLNQKEKQDYLLVHIGDLTSSLALSRKHSARTVFLEALGFYLEHGTWECWMCCSCDATFPTSSLHFMHVVTNHLGDFFSRLRKVGPVRISDWVPFIGGVQLLPLDASATCTMLKEKRELLLSNYENKTKLPKTCTFEYIDWPFSTDRTRMDLLRMIQDRLKELLSDKSLMPVHMDILRIRLLRKLEGLFDRLLRGFSFDGAHHCLCLLDASQLEETFRFLQEMSNFTTSAFTAASTSASDSWRKVTGKRSIMEDSRWAFEINGEISVCIDKLHLLLHEDSLSHGSISGGSNKNSDNMDEYASATSDSPVDNLILWIYSDHSLDDDLKKWRNLRTKKRDHGVSELIQYERRLPKILRDLHEFPEEVSIAVVPTDDPNLEDDEDPGFSLRKPEVDASVQATMHIESEHNDSELSEIEKQILQFAVDMRQLEIILKCSAAYSYKPIVLSIVKQYIREHMEDIMSHDPTEDILRNQFGRIWM